MIALTFPPKTATPWHRVFRYNKKLHGTIRNPGYRTAENAIAPHRYKGQYLQCPGTIRLSLITESSSRSLTTRRAISVYEEPYKVIETLQTVIERGKFRGTCSVCEGLLL